MFKNIFLFFLLLLIINILYAQNCPYVTSENGYTNGVFHPAWKDCMLPSSPIFDENHFQIIPNSPFNYDENTHYYHVSYPLLKKWMSRTTYTIHNSPTWYGNPINNYCKDSIIIYNKTEIVKAIKNLKPYNAKSIFLTWGNGAIQEKDFGTYDMAFDMACEIHSLTDSTNEFGKDIIMGGYLSEVLPNHYKIRNVANWVYEYFGDTIPTNPLEYDTDKMVYQNGWRANSWGINQSVPDMSLALTQYFFFERASHYIDAGCELISLGQLEAMDDNDPGHIAYFRLIKAIKRYAAKNARRHFVLMEGETQGLYYCPDFQIYIEKNFPEYLPKNNINATWKINYILADLQDKFYSDNNIPSSERQLLFDYHNQPLRMQETLDRFASSPFSYQPTELKNDDNWVFGKSKGGKNPNQWTVAHNPYYAMIDNGSVGRLKNASDGTCDEPDCIFQWGYDEMTWYAMQPDWYRMYWVCYMKNWLNDIDNAAYPVYQCFRGYYWQHYKVPSIGFGGIYTPNNWEFSELNKIMQNPESAEECLNFPTNMNIEGEQVLYSNDSSFTQTYHTSYIPNVKYVWRLLSNGIYQVITDSPYFKLNIRQNTDTVYYLSVYTLDQNQTLQSASLARFPIVISTKHNIQYYPNPVANLLYVVLENEHESIEIYDINGVKKYSNSNSNKLNTIDVSAYSSGFYLLKINQNQWFKFLKI